VKVYKRKKKMFPSMFAKKRNSKQHFILS